MLQHPRAAADVEIRVLLPRERHARQILGGRRRAHRNPNVPSQLVLELRIRREDRRLDLGGDRCGEDPLTHRSRTRIEVGMRLVVDPIQETDQLRSQSAAPEELSVGIRRHAEGSRDR